MKKRPLKISLFYCANSLKSEEVKRYDGEQEKIKINIVSLPCSGKIELIYLLKAFETGADGAILLTCPLGECKHLEGNLRAQKRAESVNSLLEESGLSKERLKVIQLDRKNSMQQINSEIKMLCETIGGQHYGIR